MQAVTKYDVFGHRAFACGEEALWLTLTRH